MSARLIIDLSIREEDFNRIYITCLGTDNKEEKRLEKKERKKDLIHGIHYQANSCKTVTFLVQLNFNGPNTDGSFTTVISNSFFSP